VDTTNKQAKVTTSNLGQFYVQAPLVCPQDTYEPQNDHPSNLKNIRLVADIGQSHLFDVSADQDWFVIEAQPNTKYTFAVTRMNAGVVSQIGIYRDPSKSPLAVAIESDVLWSAEVEGIYFVKVTPTSESKVGCDSGYTLLLSSKSTEQAQNAVYLPLISR